MILFRWLTGRALGWLGVVAVASALLSLLLDGIELGARLRAVARALGEAGPSALEPLGLALLQVPEHLVLASPLIVALASAITVSAMRRTQEWSGLAGAGIPPRRALAPFLFIGLLTGLLGLAASEWLVPPASALQARRLAAHLGGDLPQDTRTWIRRDDLVFRLDALSSHASGPAMAWRLGGEGIEAAWSAPGLDLGVEGWQAQSPVLAHTIEGCPTGSPWAALSTESSLASQPAVPALQPWRSLASDERPSARAEQVNRLSRTLACALAALVGALGPALLGPRAGVVAAALVPVLGWEVLAIAVQVLAAQGLVPSGLAGGLRVFLGICVVSIGLRTLDRPDRA